MAIFDDKATNSKTGISHRFMRPSMGVQDPELTIDLPPMVTACTGLDVLCHAIESYTTIDYTARPKPEGSLHRPTYQGSSPVSDIWACEALRLVAANLPRVLKEPADLEARSNMMLAAVYGGMGFGNAGVHLCHGMSYPVSSLVREYLAPDYLTEHPLIPHGMSVVLNAPAVFRFTAAANPAKHLEAARLMGRDVAGVPGSRGRRTAGRLPGRNHAGHAHAQRPGGRGLRARRCGGPGRKNPAPAQGHQAVAAARGRQRPDPDVPGVDEDLVMGAAP